MDDIAGILNLSSSLVSHYLRLLRVGRIVKAERQGKQVFYAAANAQVSKLLSDISEQLAASIPESPAGLDA